MHRRQVLLSLILVVILTFLVSGIAFGKGHVAANKAQICHRGVIKEVGLRAADGHVAHGDFRLPACDFNNGFTTGESCSGLQDANGDGRLSYEEALATGSAVENFALGCLQKASATVPGGADYYLVVYAAFGGETGYSLFLSR